jgi:hypothetical protein
MGAPQRLSYNRPAMRSLPHGLAAAVLAACVLSGVAIADTDAGDAEKPTASEPAPEAAPPADAPAPKSLDLDRLLHPPAVRMQPSGSILGGRDQKGWREEFRRAREEVSDLEAKVETGQNHLRSAASGEWNYTPAGGDATDPEVLKVRAQLRRDRQSLEASRQRLRDLDVEASLAGVPEAWRQP